MAHGVRINPDSFYFAGFMWTGPQAETYWRALDNAQAASLNGDVGGTWAPASFILIGGAGMWCCSAWTVLLGTVTTPNTSGSRFTHADNDYTLLDPANSNSSYTLHTSCGGGIDTSGGCARTSFQRSPECFGMTDNSAVVPATGVPRFFVPLRVHNGAMFTQITVTWTVSVSRAAGPSGVPQSLPMFRVVKIDTAGNLTGISLGSNGGWNPVPRPADGPGWYAGGVPQTLGFQVLPHDLIDTTKYSYWLEIVDESGTSAKPGNRYMNAACVFTTILDMRPD